MRWTPIGGLALALLIALALASTASASPVLTLRDDGSVVKREDRYLPPAQSLGPAPTASAAGAGAGKRASRGRAALRAGRRRTVKGELKRILKAGAISRAAYDEYRSIYVRARRTRSGLRRTRRVALGATIANLERIAASGRLTASRLPALFETVKRNRAWWSRGPLLGSGRRVSFEGSRLVWQHYPGQGLQIQWLGTFGKANALWRSKTHDGALRQLLDESLGLASGRAGGIAFEYLFRFGGGSPPWTSGLAQGTGIQALSRGAVRLDEPRYMQAARRALGIFRKAPTSGVRVKTSAGAHYLIYSFARRLRVLNAFTQALNGLYDYTSVSNDPAGRTLFARGLAQLRKELPRYDTGRWSRYSLGGPRATVSYHTLARDFLRNLCKRLMGQTDVGAGVLTVPVAPGADASPFCSAADRFTAYLDR